MRQVIADADISQKYRLSNIFMDEPIPVAAYGFFLGFSDHGVVKAFSFFSFVFCLFTLYYYFYVNKCSINGKGPKNVNKRNEETITYSMGWTCCLFFDGLFY